MSAKEYTVVARAKFGNVRTDYGPFRDRREAERCIVEAAKRTDLNPGAELRVREVEDKTDDAISE